MSDWFRTYSPRALRELLRQHELRLLSEGEITPFECKVLCFPLIGKRGLPNELVRVHYAKRRRLEDGAPPVDEIVMWDARICGCFLGRLPVEVFLHHIIEILPDGDVWSLSRTCKSLASIVLPIYARRTLSQYRKDLPTKHPGCTEHVDMVFTHRRDFTTLYIWARSGTVSLRDQTVLLRLSKDMGDVGEATLQWRSVSTFLSLLAEVDRPTKVFVFGAVLGDTTLFMGVSKALLSMGVHFISVDSRPERHATLGYKVVSGCYFTRKGEEVDMVLPAHDLQSLSPLLPSLLSSGAGITRLSLGLLGSAGADAWSTVLDSVRMPSLVQMNILNNSSLRFADLTKFLERHREILALAVTGDVHELVHPPAGRRLPQLYSFNGSMALATHLFVEHGIDLVGIKFIGVEITSEDTQERLKSFMTILCETSKRWPPDDKLASLKFKILPGDVQRIFTAPFKLDLSCFGDENERQVLFCSSSTSYDQYQRFSRDDVILLANSVVGTPLLDATISGAYDHAGEFYSIVNRLPSTDPTTLAVP